MKNSPDTKRSNSIKKGNIITLGDHILVCGEAKTVPLREILKGTIDLILTDPPYAIDYVASKRGMQEISVDKDIENDGLMSDEEYADFTKGWLKNILPHLSKKNSIYVFNCDKMIFSLRQAFVDLGVKVSQLIIWVKDRAIIGRLDYLPQHELILYGWKGTHKFERGKDKSVIFAPKPSRSKLHPTMKPIGILRKIILNSTSVNDCVYDPFGGSGSTLIACEQTKRRCVMVEIEPEYCATIVERWKKLTGHGEKIIRREREDS
ncbi:MAG: site-specific DNA-methyltransferase [Candidatus Parcubacteria bacterium]|nr:site-specific DNA-methyltransferase [Candidatus Parcubacteria bacterium]